MNQSSWKAETLIGMRLGSCTLERPLGVGGMGAVYLARQDRPRRQVAVKVLRPQLASDEQNWPIFLARFRREADATAGLDHTNIVPIYAFGEEQGVAYLIMPYLPDGSLADLLAKRGPLSIDRALRYLDDAAAALDYANAHGIIHRDVKPSNLLLHPDGRLLLGDFGIARPLDLNDLPPTLANGANGNAQLTQAGVAMGTPEFMAPEQIKGGTLGPATDIYGLGIVSYAMLTNRTPFGGTDVPTTLARQLREPPIALRRLRPDAPPGLEAAVLWALAKEPSMRPRSAGEFARAARAGALGQPFAMPTATPNVFTAQTPNMYAAQTPNPYATARLPMARMAPPLGAPPAPSAPLAPAPVAPPQPLPGAVVAGAAGLAAAAPSLNGTVALPAAPGGPATGRPPFAPQYAPFGANGPGGAGDATVYDAQRIAGYGRAGQAQPMWPGAGAPAAPARPTGRNGGFCLPAISALVVFVLVVVAAFFVASALHTNAGNRPGGGTSTTGLAHNPTPSPSPTATVAPTPTETPVPADALTASPTSLTFSCQPVSVVQIVTLTNNAPKSISWHVEHAASALRIYPSSGSLADGGSKNLRVAYTSTSPTTSGQIIFSVVSPDAYAGQQVVVTFSANCTP